MKPIKILAKPRNLVRLFAGSVLNYSIIFSTDTSAQILLTLRLLSHFGLACLVRVFPVFSSVRAFTLSGVFLHRSLSTGFRSLGKRVCLPQLRYPRLPVLPARLPQPTPLPQLCPLPTSVVSETLGMQRCLEPSLRLGELPLRVLFSCPSPRIKELLGNSISG